MANLPLPSNYQTLLVESLADLAPYVLAKDHPVVDRISKKRGGGSAVHVPIITGYGGGVGGDFAISLANAQSGAVTDAAFDVTPAVLYGHSTLNWTQARYTRDKDYSALDVATIATKSAMENAVDNFASAAIFSDGSGALATILSATNVTGSTWDITTVSPTDVSKFTQGQVLVTAANASSGLDAGTALVVGMNQIGGAFRVTVTGNTPTAGHIIGLQSQLNSGTNFPGFFGYVPLLSNRTNGIPNVSPFLGAVRDATSAGVAVSGWAYDLSIGAQPLFYGLNAASGNMANYKNAKPTELYVNAVDLPKLAQEMDQKVRYDMPSRSGIADILYMGFEIGLTTGKCEVLAEPSCPAGFAVLTKSDQWTLHSPDEPFSPASEGQVMVQNYGTNDARFSVECSGMFYTNNPPATAVFKLY